MQKKLRAEMKHPEVRHFYKLKPLDAHTRKRSTVGRQGLIVVSGLIAIASIAFRFRAVVQDLHYPRARFVERVPSDRRDFASYARLVLGQEGFLLLADFHSISEW